MHSLGGLTALRWLIVGLGAQCVSAAVNAPTPTITPAPTIAERQDPNAIELAKVLLTALPASLRQIAATNIPAVSSILWHEFLDDNKPDWFKALPSNIQSYLIVQYGPSTAWPTSTSSSSASSTMSTAVSTTRASADTASATSEPDSPSASNSGLSQGAKVGIGIGVPLGTLALLAVLIPCCFAMRKKKQNKLIGYEPPPSPGFMPHGAFQEKSTSYQEHRRPLNRSQSWDQDDELWMQPVADNVPHPPKHTAPNLPMGNSNTVIGPPLVHTHSSNRARGKRTSHSSLHAVAEVTEPDEEYAAHSLNNRLLRRSSMPLRPQDVLPVPAGASIRRKPLSTVKPHPQMESPLASPVAERGFFGHFSLLRPAMLHQDHSGSSSSGLAAASLSSPEDSRRSSANTAPTEPDVVSPVASPPPRHKTVNSFTTTSNDYTLNKRISNPFSNDYAYIEDYGPEYQKGYVDVEDGLYGGHRSLDAYPVVPEKSERRGSRGASQWPLADWPLKSLGSMGRGRRERSPQWDRVYERR
ncbi:uncharacterized protein M421DRAFT_242620 [Didymella exigua CBS 183.55]|uniref:Mid2 domain-containing protein n=1 Tax=Didymella exigua CBS 183.55 TaxID=1150837 RepID=A0A6A5RD97_9PLEO|nr:uncharacterized protein M421DRAFT_242620 [Didymella exigua CBS 183.55]KAF1925453.1 hypothetical protein M421DRAFT_242620 [Didymella exigua CBS 183.55]